MRNLLLVIGMLALCSGGVSAQGVYKTVDDEGRVSYSDKPPAKREKDEEAKLPSVNTVPGERSRGSQGSGRNRQNEPQEAEVPNYQVSIINPVPQSSVPPGQRDLEIVAGLEPSLASEHSLVFYMDGEELTQTRERQFVVQEIHRGSHTLEVEVLDAEGRPITRSEPVTVHVHRPSVINRPGS